MEITTVNAADRFDNVEFDDSTWDGTARSIYSVYTCPRCGERICFEKRNFENAKRRHQTNLLPDIARCFDELAAENARRMQDFLDWYCPTCGLAARVYVEFWAGGRYEGGVKLATVFETTPQ